MNIVCFHNPDEENGYLSNWYPSRFTVNNVNFSSMEQYMMYKKAVCFGDKNTVDKILATDDVAEIKALGRIIANYNESYWNGVRQIIVFEGLLAKFSQNEDLKKQLKATGNCIFAECAVKDKIWGIGLSMKDPNRFEIDKWNGQNLLGYALMMVRERLQLSFSWEQRKLGDVVKEITRNDPESEAPIMMITANNGFIEQSERYAFNNAGESLKKYILLKKGELAYNHGASKLRPYGSCFALTTAENARIPFVYHCFSAENQNAEFMSIELNGAEIENQLRKIVSSGARMDGLLNISFDEYTSVSVLLPGTEEQDCIADFFRQLDNLITLHQRKYDKLTNVKKSMLEKMFPKNGSNVPEIRFKGFTEAWEQRKLGNVANYRRGSFPQPYGKSEWYDGDGAMPFVQVADVSDEMNLVENTKQKISMLAQPMSVFAGKNTVLVTLQGSIGRVAITQYGAFVDRTVLIFEKYKEKIDTTFWAYIVKQKFIDEARKAPGGTIKTITKEALSDFDLSIPNYKEQQQIGTFFKQLDNLITLHQRELEKLKNLKKACLEKMFVQEEK